MTKRKLVIVASILAILILSGFAMMSLSKMKKQPAKATATEIKRYVTAVPVVYKNVVTEVEGTGRLDSRNNIELSAEVSGKILPGPTPLKKGQVFHKGDLLIKIYNEEASLALKASKSRFLTSLASILPDLKIDYPDNYENWAKFFNNIDLDSKLPPLPKITSAQEKVFIASRNLLADYYSIQSSEIRLSKYNIHAPFNGVFAAVYAEVGAIAGPGVRLATLVRTDELELEVPLEIHEAQWVEKGASVLIKSEDRSKSWNGTVSRIAGYVDAQTQSISIFVKINVDKDQPLYRGQYLRAIFQGKELNNVMELPRNAVYNENEVFIVDNGKLQKATIDVLKYYDKSLLFTGLAEGTLLVNEPLVNPVVGSPVEILNSSK